MRVGRVDVTRNRCLHDRVSKPFAVVVLILGALTLLAGGVAAASIGVDDTAWLRPTQVTSDGYAVVTAPGLLSIYGATLHVRAAGEDASQDLFVGVGHADDVDSYVGKVRRAEITSVPVLSSLDVHEVQGPLRPRAAPAALDWWAAASRPGAQTSVVWPMTDGHFVVVVMNADASSPVTADISIGITIHGMFATAMIIVAVGAALIVGGLTMIVLRGRRRSRSGVSG